MEEEGNEQTFFKEVFSFIFTRHARTPKEQYNQMSSLSSNKRSVRGTILSQIAKSNDETKYDLKLNAGKC